MPREVTPMLSAVSRLQAAKEPVSRPGSALSDLFGPLDRLLIGGGDPRLDIEPSSGANAYGCRPSPCPDMLSFASCTATSISERAYARAGEARENLMRSVISEGLEAAFDARIEAMRGELKACLGLPQSAVDVVLSPSGTDSQLQALSLVRALLGPSLATIIVAADQTGSGTADTARGCHFSAATANGTRVAKGQPIDGLADGLDSIALPSLVGSGGCCPQAESDAQVLGAVETAVANGRKVLLQIMDCSKLGWRAPSDPCLDEIARRWPDQVQIVVDACQMRLGRPRLRKYLDRGYIVIVTGSKFFTGPPFSGALLVPAGLAKAFDAVTAAASGLRNYFGRSDWPGSWASLRSCFPIRANFGQWLRWEAALEEMRAYYSVPDEFRRWALKAFGEGVERVIVSSPSLRLLPQSPAAGNADDEELAQATIFPFAIVVHDGRALSLGDCRKIYRALTRTARMAGSANASKSPEIAAELCLVGQPVALGDFEGHPAAALRICAGARLIGETWSGDEAAARGKLRRELDHVGAVVAKIEWLVAHPDDLDS
jgi:hypothetical protein